MDNHDAPIDGTPIELLFQNLHEIIGIDFETFYRSIFDEHSDWAMVIKLCAIIEAAASHLITISIGNETLRRRITLLPLADTSVGKLEFIKDLNLLSDDVRRFIKEIVELRNMLAHDIRRVEFNLSEHFDFLRHSNPNKFKALREVFLFEPDAPVKPTEKRMSLGEQAKDTMYGRCLKFLAQVYLEHRKKTQDTYS